MVFFRNFDAANKKRNLVRFALMMRQQNLDWIDDTPFGSGLQTNVIAYSPTPVFDAATANILAIVMTGNITSSSIVYNGSPSIPSGTELILDFIQDNTGGRTVVLPPTIILDQGTSVDLGPRKLTRFSLVYDGVIKNAWECIAPPFSFST